MPSYEWVCDSCGEHGVEVRRITKGPRKRCPSCHHKVRNIITGGQATIFRGKGWPDKERRQAKDLKAVQDGDDIREADREWSHDGEATVTE